MRRKAWRTGAVMNKSAFYLSGRRGSGLASMSSFVCMRVCCVEIDRWSNGGVVVLTILLLGQIGGGIEAKRGV